MALLPTRPGGYSARRCLEQLGLMRLTLRGNDDFMRRLHGGGSPMVVEPDPTRGSYQGVVESGLSATTSEAEHLLKVAASVAKDASGVWAEMWAQFRPHVTPNGAVGEEMQKGFVPACGWAEFIEKYWLLKHYLDSIDRVCRRKR